MSIKTYLPKIEDYPDKLDIVNNPHSPYYYHSIEASASAYFFSSKSVQNLFVKRLEHVYDLTNGKRFESTLDVGTGVGILLPYLSSISKEVVAIDYSNIVDYTQLMVQKKKLNNIHLAQADLLKCVPDKKYDLIICLSVLEHISDITSAMSKLHDLLKPGGTLIVGYPIENPIINTIRKTETYFRKNKFNKEYIKNKYKDNDKFHGHVSHWKDIDQGLESNFKIIKKINQKKFGLSYYAIRQATL